MAHGQDVANLGRIPGVTAATRWVLRRSSAVICNSHWLAVRLTERIPAAGAEDRGRRLRRRPRGLLAAPGRRGPPGARLGRRGPGLPLRRLADRAQERGPPRGRLRSLGRGRLAFVGDGPLRAELEGRPGVTACRPDPAGRGPAVGRRLRRALPALADRALRPGDPGGDGDGAQRRRHRGRRAARVRHRGGRRPGRSGGRRRASGRARRRRPPWPRPTTRRARRPGARCQADGGADGRRAGARCGSPTRLRGRC